MQRPPLSGMHHVAMFANAFEETRRFYVDIVGMAVEWQPDPDNIYLTSGRDNVAIHRASKPASAEGQRLDHIGFILPTMEDVDAWFAYLGEFDVPMIAPPKTHRDGARSFYCQDPNGTTVQFIYHPPLAS